jgi:hypothetical protein
MSSSPDPRPGRAETSFRDAFARIKRGTPQLISKDSPISQNNVAKEAGCDPSALKKARFPSLVAEIQQWVEEHAFVAKPSPRQNLLAARDRNHVLKDKIEVLKIERDHALSLLVEADTKIMELVMENLELKERIASQNVTPLRKTSMASRTGRTKGIVE